MRGRQLNAIASARARAREEARVREREQARDVVQHVALVGIRQRGELEARAAGELRLGQREARREVVPAGGEARERAADAPVREREIGRRDGCAVERERELRERSARGRLDLERKGCARERELIRAWREKRDRLRAAVGRAHQGAEHETEGDKAKRTNRARLQQHGAPPRKRGAAYTRRCRKCALTPSPSRAAALAFARNPARTRSRARERLSSHDDGRPDSAARPEGAVRGAAARARRRDPEGAERAEVRARPGGRAARARARRVLRRAARRRLRLGLGRAAARADGARSAPRRRSCVPRLHVLRHGGIDRAARPAHRVHRRRRRHLQHDAGDARTRAARRASRQGRDHRASVRASLRAGPDHCDPRGWRARGARRRAGDRRRRRERTPRGRRRDRVLQLLPHEESRLLRRRRRAHDERRRAGRAAAPPARSRRRAAVRARRGRHQLAPRHAASGRAAREAAAPRCVERRARGSATRAPRTRACPSRRADCRCARPRIPRRPRHVWNQYVVRVPAARRDALRAHLTSLGIGTSVYYPRPLHLQPCFAGGGQVASALPVAEALARETLALPIYPELTGEQIARVASEVVAFLKR
ncbi:MAG: DegT/DnrJ/EryC1/StrS family aminotransferase [Deltaproteobacteria bacterium]|nr:DegT/DnrJ/EryC1/StrS family aminotransferase [Deltaproteobacteria bacterium]